MSWFRMIENLNQCWGYFIARHPWWHIIGSLILTAIITMPIYRLHIEHDIRASFSPKNSRSAYENNVYKEFFNLTTSPQRSFVLFTAKDNGSMLRQKQLDEVHQLDAYLQATLKIVDKTTGVQRCHPLCKINQPFHIISSAIKKVYANDSDRDEVVLDYPMSYYQGTPLFVGMNMIEVQTSDFVFPENNSKIISVKRLILWYFSRADTKESFDSYRDISLELFQKSQNATYFKYIDFEIFGDQIANKEMIRGAIEATALMTIGFLLLLLFVFVSVYRRLGRGGYKTLAVPIVVAVSVICPFLGSAAAFGVLTFLGYDTYTIMCVTPFLVLGIGVDDAFIIIQSWNQNKAIKYRSHRMAAVFVNVGPSITITSLTNTVAFGIGFATPTPQMSLFCFTTSMAVFFDYILTFTLLAPVIYLITPEAKATTENGIIPKNTKDVKPPLHQIAHIEPSEPISTPILYYTKFICSNFGRATAVLVLILLYAVSYTGVITMKCSFEPSKAFPSDSPLALSIYSVRSVFNEFFPINIIVHNPPDISDKIEYERFYEMVSALEALPESYGRNRTLLWLIPYERLDRQTADIMEYFGYYKDSYVPSYDNVDFFLEVAGYPPSIKYTKDEKNKTVITAFQFTIISRDMAEWANRAVFEEKCRDIIFKYPEFNATLYDGDSAILALLLTVKIDVIGSIAVTVACMTVICSFFIYNQIGVTLIAFTISSICFCLVGLMSWWGNDLDPVTMIDLLLATGFSVDYTAHIAHQFYVKTGTRDERISHSLNEMCTPMLQAGISTVLCMLPLIFVPTYAIVAFAKTVFIVVGVGLLHGLFFLPILLYILPEQILCFGRCGVHQETTTTEETSESKQPFLPSESTQN